MVSQVSKGRLPISEFATMSSCITARQIFFEHLKVFARKRLPMMVIADQCIGLQVMNEFVGLTPSASPRQVCPTSRQTRFRQSHRNGYTTLLSDCPYSPDNYSRLHSPGLPEFSPVLPNGK